MKSLFKIVLYLEVLKSNWAIFENPFQIGYLFVKVLEIDLKIHQMQVELDKKIETFQGKVSTFRQEIEVALSGYEKHPTPPNTKGYLG